MGESEKEIKDFGLDESIDYILGSFKTTQYNQDALDYFAKVMEHIRKGPKDNEDRTVPDGTPYPDDEDESCVIDHSPDGEYTQEIPCCDTEPETINLPFPTLEGVTEIPLNKSYPPLSPMHDWESRLSSVLYEMIDMLENDQDHGYFDSIIDVQTHALLIEKAMRKYCDEHNKRWCKHEGEEYEGRADLQTTPEQIKDHNRGGYSVKDWNRIHKVLTDKEYVDEREESGDKGELSK